MSEPDEVVLEAAHYAASAAHALWLRRRSTSSAGLDLRTVRRRLELTLAAVFGPGLEVRPAAEPPPPSLLARLAGRGGGRGGGRGANGPLARTDGRRVLLPPTLDGGSALDRYRLLALEQGFRARRGTAALVPAESLERDLYLLAEAVAVDRLLATRFPTLVAELASGRRRALHARPAASRAQTAAVERLVRAVLLAPPTEPPPSLPLADGPADSCRWARAEAARIRALPGRYAAPEAVELWGGSPVSSEAPPAEPEPPGGDTLPPTGRTARLTGRPRLRGPQEGENEEEGQAAPWIVRADDPQEKVEDPMGLRRPADRDDQADAGDLAELLSELPEARLVRSSTPVFEVLESDVAVPRPERAPEPRSRTSAVAYPEWDFRAGAYRLPGALVRESGTAPGDPDWAAAVRRRHRGLIVRVRRDFEKLRPRNDRQRRQRDGSELDVEAYVEAFGDRRGNGTCDDRMYVATRPRRREAAITLLVDASASTDSWVSGVERVIDVEREALVVVLEALKALGDPLSILSFSGRGPGGVSVRMIKDFPDVDHGPALRRIAALEPDGFTRVGAAIRHATAKLCRQPAGHRLLLLLSDGRPNDEDVYEGRYGVEDTRRSVVEARMLGVHVFCLTVDRDASRYAPHTFGPGHYAVLTHPDRLPAVLPGVIGRLLRT